jgi:hypothetical protein
MRKILVVGSAWRSSLSTACGMAPPVLVMYRRCGNRRFWIPPFASNDQTVGTPANAVIRSASSTSMISLAKTNLISTVVPPC